MRKRKLRCLLGLHSWVAVKVNDGELYTACRDCGKVGGDGDAGRPGGNALQIRR